MTTSNATAKTAKDKVRFRLPDRPEREPDDMTSAEHLSETGLHHHLKQFLANPETTIVSGEKYITARRGADMRYPDLLVAFEVDPAAYRETNGYVLSQQGKPPDFVLEIASEGTGHIDVGEKRGFYEGLGIPEYWRFDQTPTGQWHGARLAGDGLVDGKYRPIEIAELPDGGLEGYSPALDLLLRWEEGELAFYDPATSRPIATYESQRARADREHARADQERARADQERARAETAEARRDAELAAAEARIRELETELRRLRGY